ncbi:MAG: N-acetyltransferase [Rhizobiaceae bacterium]|nr:N-acetyltransferase [Rhizobiaceae bacterium]
MDIKREDTDTKGRYVLNQDGSTAHAELTFSKVGKSMIIIDHTEVPEAFRGTGAGLKLVERAVEDAREMGIKIMPLCPFAAAQFKRHPEWADTLKQKGVPSS